MRADWLVLTQLKVVTGLGLSSLQEEEGGQGKAGQSRSLNSPTNTARQFPSPRPPHYRGLVEWTAQLPLGTLTLTCVFY